MGGVSHVFPFCENCLCVERKHVFWIGEGYHHCARRTNAPSAPSARTFADMFRTTTFLAVFVARALDTYLRYRRRPYDDGAVCAVAPPTTTNDDDDDAHEDLDDRLARRVFMTIRRLATIERDDPLVPTLASRATALTKLRLVDAAKILDVCALFGPDNPRPTAALVADLIAMFGEPLLNDLAAVRAMLWEGRRRGAARPPRVLL